MGNTAEIPFAEHGVRVQKPKGTCLYRRSEEVEAQSVYFLKEGICALTSLTRNGEENIYLYFHPEQIIGFNQLVMSKDERQRLVPEFRIVTKTACSLWMLPAALFQERIRRQPAFNAVVMETIADNYRDALCHFSSRMEEPAGSRLCRLLLQVAGKDGAIPRFFTYPELARYLGTHPVTVSRLMGILIKRGHLKKSREGLSVADQEALWGIVASGSLKYQSTE